MNLARVGGPVYRGVVESFDEHVGLGWLVGQRPGAAVPTDGDPVAEGRFQFHCTTIVDGSRRIGVGQPVSFIVGPAGPGRWEAFQVAPVDP